MDYANSECNNGARSEMSELNLSKLEIGKCCSNKSVYLVTYTIGTKWKVCYECIELEIFNSGIVKKERIK